MICTTAEEWGKLTFQHHGPILICQNQSQNVETLVLRWFYDGELKSITLQFMNIDCALYVGSVVPLME
jgi:hypothetical protein